MKKVIGFLLVCAVVFAFLAVGGTAEEAVTPGPKFEIDGNLDDWYLSDGENPPGDYHYYHMSDLNAISKTDGTSPYDDSKITASMWTAYDPDYVYVYVKVWDDSLDPMTDEIKHNGGDSGWIDSIEVRFDPDPNSRLKDGWWYDQYIPNAGAASEKQGDVQFRVSGAGFAMDDYYDLTKPGYHGVAFGDYIQNRENCYPFYFEGEKANEYGVTSGYGIEVRLPRADDESGSYKLSVAVNDYSENENQRYALATNEAWQVDYGISIRYDDEVNPFFHQDISAKLVVKAIDELPNPVTESNRADVEKIRGQYNDLTAEQKDYVKNKNYNTLLEAEKTLNIDNPSSNDSSTVQGKRGDINGDGNVNANDALLVLHASVGKAALTADQEKAADLTGDGKVNAADALMILRIAVEKEQ